MVNGKNFMRMGDLKEIGNYENGERHGEWKYFDENGKLKKIREF